MPERPEVERRRFEEERLSLRPPGRAAKVVPTSIAPR
jgi:hypothetical protein